MPDLTVGPTAVLHRAQSCAASEQAALAEIRAGLPDIPMALLVLFVSPRYERAAVATALAEFPPDVDIIGCTTAGEIGAGGYLEDHIVAVAFPTEYFRAAVGVIPGLSSFDPESAREVAFELRAQLALSETGFANEIAFLLSDGLSLKEDQLVWALSDALGQSPLVGGSAGDGLRFKQTFVLHQRRFVPDAAVLAVIRTSCTVTAFRFDHLQPTDKRMVVTDADPAQRLVRKINGMTAGPEYARILGKDPEQLSPFIFAANPVVSKLGDEHHVLAIQRVEPDGTLRFFSAIETGLVLRLAHGDDLVGHLDKALGTLVVDGQCPEILVCDCILRRLEAESGQTQRAVSEVLDRFGVAGFNTYGEQFNMVHVNQTFTGLAFYPPSTGGMGGS